MGTTSEVAPTFGCAIILGMLKTILADPTPVGRLAYFKNTFLIALVQIVLMAPSKVGEVFEKQGQPFPEGIQLGLLIVGLLGSIFAIVLSAKNIFKRARDIEGKLDINKWKWGFIGLFPIVAIFGQLYLLFKTSASTQQKS